MPKLPRIPASTAIKAFELDGWSVARVSSSHFILVKSGSIYTLSIPRHGNKDLGLGLLKTQINNAGLSVQDFIDLLEQL